MTSALLNNSTSVNSTSGEEVALSVDAPSASTGSRRRVTLLSYHYLGSKRKAGFHWIADACWRLGWDVVFVTAPVSWMSSVGGNFRFEYPLREEANRLKPIGDRLSSYVLSTLFHPVAFRQPWLDRLTSPVLGRYGSLPLGPLDDILATSDVVIVESTPAVMFVPQIRRKHPDVRIVYRVSDDFTFIPVHSSVRRVEERIVDQFDLISAASHKTVHRLGADHATYHPHGLASHLYDAVTASPYAPSTTNVVWVGTNSLDDAFLDIASSAFPEWTFHVIGPVPASIERSNVRFYGELPFEQTIPFVKFADIGLSTFPPVAKADEDVPAEALGIRSLKTTQYSYCGLPIVARADLRIDRDAVFHYDVSDPASVRDALLSAKAAGRDPRLADGVTSWDDLARILLGLPASV